MEKISEREFNPQLSVIITTIGQFQGLNQGLFDKIFFGNPFCPTGKDNPAYNPQILRQACSGLTFKDKLILNMPVCPLEDELLGITKILDTAREEGIPGVSVSSYGMAAWIRRDYPELKIYFDSFSNVYSLKDAELFRELGSDAGLLAYEAGLDECESIMKESGLEIIIPVFGRFPIAFSRYCFFYPGRLPQECSNQCNDDYRLSFSGSSEVLQKGRALYSAKRLSMFGHLPLLLSKGLFSFRIEGWIMPVSEINKTADSLRQMLGGAFNNHAYKELFEISTYSLCNGFLFAARGEEYIR
ncbi:MAG: U32 family peptidase [Candidatus Omnitrophota bacterium]